MVISSVWIRTGNFCRETVGSLRINDKMTKGVTFFITSIIVSLFIIGCPKSAPAETVDTSKAEPPKAELTKIEPNKPPPATSAPPQDEAPMDEL